MQVRKDEMAANAALSRISRRGFVAAIGAVGASVIAVACGGAAPTAAPSKPAAEPTAPPKAAEAKPADKPAAAAPAAEPTAPAAKPTVAPTPTLVPTATPVPYASGDKVLLRVHWEGIYFNEFAKLINEYNSTQGPKDKIYVVLERQLQPQTGTGAGAVIATFIADFQAGTSEDIYHLNDQNLPDLAVRNFFMAAPKEVEEAVKRDWRPGTFETGVWEGKFYGYPTEYQSMTLVVNKKLFEDGTGLTLPKDEPKTWDDLRRIAKTVTKRDSAGKLLRQGLIWKTENPERQMVERVVLHATEGEDFIDTKGGGVPKVNFKSETSMKIMNLYKGLVDDGSMVGGVGHERVLTSNRLGVMCFLEAFAIFFYYKALGDANVVGEQYAIRPFSSNGSKKITNTRNFHYEVSAQSKVKDQAWKFLKWMNEGPEFRMANFQVDVFGFLPAVKAVDLPKWWPEQLRETWREALSETVPIPNIRGMPRVIDITAQYQNEVILGKASIQDAMNKADAEIKKALEEAYR
jgi:ABC-type glycerol-3-phosphate transport system substrate-binding protein